jgi:RHS repeat-associated protein
VFGHDLISQRQLIGGTWTTSFFGYDGAGSVRFLTNESGTITDTYNYDAFGTLVSSTGSTPNDYLFVGEQFDVNVGFYYLRARYMNPFTGRFITRDTYEGKTSDPSTLHKYLYVANDPVNKIDPSGQMFLMDLAIAGGGRVRDWERDAGQKIKIGQWIKLQLTKYGIGIRITVATLELARRMDVSLRLHHYTEYPTMMLIMATGIASPSGTNYLTTDIFVAAEEAENKLAVCHPLDVRITLDVYPIRDGLNGLGNQVPPRKCGLEGRGGWLNKDAPGGAWQITNTSPIPYYDRKPQVFPLLRMTQ